MAIALRQSVSPPIRITILLLVIAGLQESTLIAQSAGAVAVSATVIESPQLGTPTATLERAGAREAGAFPAGSALLAALRAGAFHASRPGSPESALPAPSSPLEASRSPSKALLPRADSPPAAPKRSGRPETPPTVRITVAYAAN